MIMLEKFVNTVTKDTKLREIQYKILNRYVATNKWLYKRKLVSSDICSFCKSDVQDIEHLFWGCEKVQILWQELINWLYPFLIIRDLKAEDVIFGFKNKCSGNILFNCILLVAKKFILNCKYRDVLPNVKYLQRLIEVYHKTELYSAFGNEKKMKMFRSKWDTCIELFEH